MADTNAGAAQGSNLPGAGYRSLVMVLLFLVYAFNFLDRQIISILAIPIKEDLGLTDEQLGLLGGIAFALLYSTLGVPIAWFADRFNRTWIMTAALTIWSGFTALSGFAQNFMQLFLARVGVGVGEAGGVAPAYTIIADYYPPSKRARALAIYSLGIPVGSAFGVIAGSQIAGGGISDALDWRSAFFIVGIAGTSQATRPGRTIRTDRPSASGSPFDWRPIHWPPNQPHTAATAAVTARRPTDCTGVPPNTTVLKMESRLGRASSAAPAIDRMRMRSAG